MPSSFQITENETLSSIVDVSGGYPIVSVNGDDTLVGAQFILDSGAFFRLNADGSFTYNPDTAWDYLGPSVLHNEVIGLAWDDGAGHSGASSFTITIMGENDAPVAVDDVFNIGEGAVLDGDVFAANGSVFQDSDVDAGDALNFVVTDIAEAPGQVGHTVTLASGAELTLNANGQFEYDDSVVALSLGLDEVVADVFHYTMSDPWGGTDDATVTIYITSASQTLNGDGGANMIDGGAGNDVINGKGGADTLLGGDGDDTIDGGAGADDMQGGDGNDIYYVNSTMDHVTEPDQWGFVGMNLTYVGPFGVDTIYSSVSFTAPVGVEHLVLTGNANINGAGSIFSDAIDGNSGNNILDDGTDYPTYPLLAGDILAGHAGNDTYVIHNSANTLIEAPGEGVDLVQSSVTWTLGKNFENLTLVGAVAIDATGNNAANTLTGNNAANLLRGQGGVDTLNGRGGADHLQGGAGNDKLDGGVGHDVLVGGAGSDIFIFTAPATAANSDTIDDFNVPADTIQLDNAAFTALGAPGVLSGAAFFAGANAHDANDRILYDAKTGKLFYDADGTGNAAKILVATLDAHLAITHADFVVI